MIGMVLRSGHHSSSVFAVGWPSSRDDGGSLASLSARIHRVKGVAQGDFAYPLRVRIPKDARVDEEDHGHPHLLAGPEDLLVEAEALDLAEIFAGLDRRDVERRGPLDRARGEVLRGVEGH